MKTLSQRNQDDRRNSRRRQQIELRVLANAGGELSASLDLTSVLRKAVRLAVGAFADICLFYRIEDGGIKLVAADGIPALLDEGRAAFDTVESSVEQPIVAALLEARPSLINDMSPVRPGDGFAGRMRSIFASSAIIAPASSSDGVMGAMVFIQGPGKSPGYNQEDFEIAQQFARGTGQAMLSAALYASQRRIAELFQEAHLPQRLPASERFRVDALYESATGSALLGGDWYDSFVLEDGRIFLSIGDVLGHGVEAAVLMSKIRQSLRGAVLATQDVARLLCIADAAIKLESRDAWATAVLAIYAPEERLLSLARAGHPPPICYNRQQIAVLGAQTPQETALPLGLWEDGFYPSSENVQLQCGDTVAFFTDGLIEFSRDLYEGYGALYVAMRSNGPVPATDRAKFLRDSVVPDTHSDDIAIMTLSIS